MWASGPHSVTQHLWLHHASIARGDERQKNHFAAGCQAPSLTTSCGFAYIGSGTGWELRSFLSLKIGGEGVELPECPALVHQSTVLAYGSHRLWTRKQEGAEANRKHFHGLAPLFMSSHRHLCPSGWRIRHPGPPPNYFSYRPFLHCFKS